MNGFTIKDGELRIDLRSFVEALDGKDKKEIADLISSDDWLWKGMLQALSDSNGFYYPDKDDAAWWFSESTMRELREKLLPLLPDLQRVALEKANADRDEAEKRSKELLTWAWGRSGVFGRFGESVPIITDKQVMEFHDLRYEMKSTLESFLFDCRCTDQGRARCANCVRASAAIAKATVTT